jgi:hypothetical protein
MKSEGTPKGKRDSKQDPDLRPEYDFDYSAAQPNRFAKRKTVQQVVVVLDPDVSRVFTNPQSVNTALRALLSAMPSGRSRISKKRS